MTPKVPGGPADRPFARRVLGLFLGLLGLYLLVSPGELNAVDGWPALAEAVSLVEHGTVHYDQLRPGVDLTQAELARAMSHGDHPQGTANKYGAGLHAAYVPAYAASRVAAGALHARAFTLFKATFGLTHALAAAAAIALFALWARRIAGPAGAIWTAALLGVGTFVWPLSAISYSDPIQMFSVTLVLWLAARVAEHDGAARLHALGAACGWAVACKPTNGLLVVACAATAIDGAGWRRLAAFAGAWAAATLAALLCVNGWRYHGDWTYFGYAPGISFTTPLAFGTGFLLFSSRAGWFWFVPCLPLGLAGLAVLVRRRPAVGIPLAAGLAAHFVMSAKFMHVHAGYCLGPRYLLPLTPLLGLGVLQFVPWVRGRARPVVGATSLIVCAAWTFPMAVTQYFDMAHVQTAVEKAGGEFDRAPVPVLTARLLAAKSLAGPDRVPLAAFSVRPVEGEREFASWDAMGLQCWWIKPHPLVPDAARWIGAALCAAVAAAGVVLLVARPRAPPPGA